MKAVLVLIALHLLLACAMRAGDVEEKDFEGRLVAFAKAADMALVDSIYARGDQPQKGTVQRLLQLEAVIVRRIKLVTFQDIPPRMRERLAAPVEEDGQQYLPNLNAYRMVTIEYEIPIKNGSVGCSFLTGIQDGHLFIMGLKKFAK